MANLYRKERNRSKLATPRSSLKPNLSYGEDLDLLQKELVVSTHQRLQNIVDCQSVSKLKARGTNCGTCKHLSHSINHCKLHDKTVSLNNLCLKHVEKKGNR
jgi:hypothetical protein